VDFKNFDRIRIDEESNYRAIFSNGKTIRMPIDHKKPVTPLKYPEFWDVKITNVCDGRCPYCYQDSKETEDHPKNLPEKIKLFFEEMPKDKMPFQVAIGGGEPTAHSEFIDILETFYDMKIVPNYTTNGSLVSHSNPDILAATKEKCGGIAVTAHEHMEDRWKAMVRIADQWDIVCHLHILIFDLHSVKYFEKIYNEFKNQVEYFVILPMVEMGRAKNVKVDYKSLFGFLDSIENISNIAFGAQGYNALIEKGGRYLNGLYDPEMFSKFVDFTKEEIITKNSSFER